MSINVLNTNADLSGKTVVTAEGDRTITGLISYSRSGSAPFAVNSGAANVSNLDADKLDGQHAPAGTLVGTTDAQVLTNKTLTAPTIDTPTVTASINLTGGQISFPAVQIPSAGVNVLDDYEEGTWTPVVGGASGTSGQTYTVQVGRYVKIGRLVHAFFNTTFSAKGTVTGNVQIQGIPFTIENVASQQPPLIISFFSAMGTSWINLAGFGVGNTTTASLNGLAAAGTTPWTALVTADLTNTTQLIGCLTYVASA